MPRKPKQPKPQSNPLNDAEMAAKIARLVAIRPVANEYRELCSQIKDELQYRKIDCFETQKGEKAKLISKPSFEWLVAALEVVLDKSIFNALCPRKADTRKLNQRIAAYPEDAKLAACRVQKPGKHELEVLAAGESQAPISIAIEGEEDEAA